MKANTWVKKPTPRRKWSYGLVRDTDGVVKVCEIFSHPFGYGIVGKSEISNKGRRLFPGVKQRIMVDLFIALGMGFGVPKDKLYDLISDKHRNGGAG